MQRRTLERSIEVACHVLTWGYIFMSPLLFKHSFETIDRQRLVNESFVTFCTCLVFYLNYFLLIPRFVLQRKNIKWFVLLNALIYFGFQTIIEVHVALHEPIQPELPMALEKLVQRPHRHLHDGGPPKLLFIFRGFLTFVFAVAASVSLRLSFQWRSSEQARARAELGRSQAELMNLKNQINPHFLLNTLNNIYALTAFDTQKAQQAIMELAKMLRYMLYENQSERVSLSKEVEFIQCYIALMKLRIYTNVDVQVNLKIPENEEVPVAPLIFISLVENAFKHGISPTEPSFIHITMESTSKHLSFCCFNSNFPKSKNDCSPGGIGLKQVEGRLKMSYPGRYSWQYGPTADGVAYRSEIHIWE